MTGVSREKRFEMLMKVNELIIKQRREGSERVGGVRILKLVIELLGSRCSIYDGPAFFREYGRSLGYDIPAYAYSGSGEIREMLAEVGAHNVREWYAHVGIRGDLYDRIGEYRLVVPINRNYERRCYLIAPTWEEVGNGYAEELALHLIDYCLNATAKTPPAGIIAGDKTF